MQLATNAEITKPTKVLFMRKRLLLKAYAEPTEIELTNPITNDQESSVLVVNSSHEMAKEITLQLTLKMPLCSIMYAPSVALAKLLLRRRRIDLVISDTVLPDGNIEKIKPELENLDPRPEILVVGKFDRNAFKELGYLASRNTGLSQNTEQVSNGVSRAVKALGADIRNDLNNPLQEIVAMIFVAQASTSNSISPVAEQALQAINQAATKMAGVVSGLEDKIRKVVES